MIIVTQPPYLWALSRYPCCLRTTSIFFLALIGTFPLPLAFLADYEATTTSCLPTRRAGILFENADIWSSWSLPCWWACIPWSLLAGHQPNSFPLSPQQDYTHPAPLKLDMAMWPNSNQWMCTHIRSEGHHFQECPFEPFMGWTSMLFPWLDVNAWDDLENHVLKVSWPWSSNALWPGIILPS